LVHERNARKETEKLFPRWNLHLLQHVLGRPLANTDQHIVKVLPQLLRDAADRPFHDPVEVFVAQLHGFAALPFYRFGENSMPEQIPI